MNSGLRSLPQQYLLSEWSRAGRCGIGLAAAPGTSNHEGGLAIDIEDDVGWRSALAAEGFRWLGPSDAVHFDYVGGGTTDVRSLSVLAFQRLWNRNHPEDRIGEDSDYGASTASRLARAPSEGFPIGAVCGAPVPAPTPTTAAIEVYWARQADARYELRALAPASVTRVEYQVDGLRIATATRATASNFPAQYTFASDGLNRLLTVIGFDATGARVASGNGAIDVTADTGVFIKQLGAGLYEVGLERASAAITAIEVDANSFALTDSETGTRRSTRLAVRSRFSSLGARTFTIRTYGSSGLRGSLRRTLTLQ